MTLLLFIVVVLVVLALPIYAARQRPRLAPPLTQLIVVLLVLIAIGLIVQRAGLL